MGNAGCCAQYPACSDTVRLTKTYKVKGNHTKSGFLLVGTFFIQSRAEGNCS
jgi:hypothetical protein